MKIADLMQALLGHDGAMEVTLDVDDGVRGSYKDILRVRVVTPPAGEPFLALDADYAEAWRGVPVG